MLDTQERAAEIRSQADNLAFARGWQIVPDDALLARSRAWSNGPCP